MTDLRTLCAELVDELEDWVAFGDEADCADAHALVDRARAALAHPEPQGPTDEELLDLGNDLMGDCLPCDPDLLIAFARAVLARWGRPAVEPVLVAERLPGPEDCDAEGRCWMFGKVEGDWRLISTINPGLPRLRYCFSHWLPHHALPVPQQEHKK